MRLLLLFAVLFSICAGAGCGSTPAITVVKLSKGEVVEDVKGDPVKFKHPEQESFSGGKPGYRLIRSHDEWNAAWPAGNVPDLPEALKDTQHTMAIFATSESKGTLDLKIKRAVETAEMIFIWISEKKLGEGCLKKEHPRAYELVTAPRLDKPVRFYVQAEPGEPCGPPPVATVECRLAGTDKWYPALSAQPGDAIECAMNATSQGKFEVIEKILSMGDLPAGSSAKLKFSKGSERGVYEVDVYGKYTLKGEAADEGGRRASGAATVDVKPPKTKDVLVQLVWTGFDIKDYADAFPRVNLRVQEPGARGQRCSAEIPVPGLCDVKTRGSYTYMTIPAGDRKLPISVQYLEDKPEKGPSPCVHVWFDGERTADTCDHGKRAAEEIWRAGVVDTTTGKLSTEVAPEPPPPPPSAVPSAKPAPKPAPKKK